MVGDVQGEVVAVEPHEGESDQRGFGQIETGGGVVGGDPPGGPAVRGNGEIDGPEAHLDAVDDDLPRATRRLDEGRPQDVVAVHERLRGAAQQAGVDRAGEGDRRLHGVGVHRIGIEGRVEVDTRLRRRQRPDVRQPGVVVAQPVEIVVGKIDEWRILLGDSLFDGRTGGRVAGRGGGGGDLGERGDGLRLEDRPGSER